MSLIRIKQLNERTATAGLHMGRVELPKFRRKLEPGEIVEIPDDMKTDNGENLLEGLYETGLIDMVPDTYSPTRPLDYEDAREAKICSPTYRPQGKNEIAEAEKVRANVLARLEEQLSKSPPKADSPDKDATAKPSRRQQRRARVEAAQHGQTHPT